MLIYVAGKYSGNVDDNIEVAAKIAADLWSVGHAVICPHLNTAHFETRCNVTYEQYLTGDLNMVARVDALVMVPGWEKSKGAKIEYGYAQKLAIPIYFAPDYPLLHPTEVNCPAQVVGFREIIGMMYRVHLDKNADYSAANILATGEVGLVTRLWDKTARLMNLTGLHFEHILSKGVRPPRTPKNEAIDDTYLDLAVCAIIGLLLRKGHWGQ